MMLFSSRGIPESISHVPGHGVHTYKLTTPDGGFRYCKFHFRPVQGFKGLSSGDATRMAGVDPDFHNLCLWNAIKSGNYPVWKLCIQVMDPAQAESYGPAVFDITKVWPHKDFPLIEVGQMTLNKTVMTLCATKTHTLK